MLVCVYTYLPVRENHGRGSMLNGLSCSISARAPLILCWFQSFGSSVPSTFFKSFCCIMDGDPLEPATITPHAWWATHTRLEQAELHPVDAVDAAKVFQEHYAEIQSMKAEMKAMKAMKMLALLAVPANSLSSQQSSD